MVLFGTGGHFSVSVLKHLCACNLAPVALVLPEYPAASKPGLSAFDVENDTRQNSFVFEAKALSIPVIHAPKPRQSELPRVINRCRVDYILVACWPYLLSTDVLKEACNAALNLHPSLLPAYRGADPVSAQLANKERALGVSLHLLSEQFDRGDIIAQ